VPDTIEIGLDLLCTLKWDAPDRWVAGCPALDVYSQGSDESDAKRCLKEAITLWVESCLERGTLDEALRQLGFHRRAEGSVEPLAAHHQAGALGEESFSIHLTIPAYQTAALSRSA